MIYEYECSHCGKREDVMKSISEYDREELCQSCKMSMKRLVSRGFFHGEKVENAYFSNALGQMVRGSTHERQLAKERGFEEVGNENPHKHLKPTQKDYMDEKSWQV